MSHATHEHARTQSSAPLDPFEDDPAFIATFVVLGTALAGAALAVQAGRWALGVPDRIAARVSSLLDDSQRREP